MGKLIYGLNTVAALLLLVSFVLPYLPPSTFPTLSLLSLAVSPLILLNILFALYWLVRMKRQFLISFLVLLVAYFHFHPFFEFSSEGDTSDYDQTLSILSYNVRLFNAYETHPEVEKVASNFAALLDKEDPDVVCIQEFYADYVLDMSTYPYQFIHFNKKSNTLGHAIFSKYPLINKGGFDFEDSFNNTIYADAIVGADTIRIYNLHLQSVGILPSVDFLQQKGTERIKKRIAQSFVEQEIQINEILAHKETSPYPVILSGDFNNTPFSYTYKELKREMKDAFLERGNGLGTTYSFNSYPMRIDYILGTEGMDVVKFNTIDETFSDHNPVHATFGW
ncbi:MAG: endonuclease/exonuclease/phosphatase family protein [Bacteroidota bacterium]